MKKENKKTAYSAPKLETLTFETERGFAVTGNGAEIPSMEVSDI